MRQSTFTQAERSVRTAAIAATLTLLPLAFASSSASQALPSLLGFGLFVGGFGLAAFAAGFVSGRPRDMAITWLAMSLVWATVYWIQAALQPDAMAPEDGPVYTLIFVGFVLAPYAAIGHWLGVTAAHHR